MSLSPYEELKAVNKCNTGPFLMQTINNLLTEHYIIKHSATQLKMVEIKYNI